MIVIHIRFGIIIAAIFYKDYENDIHIHVIADTFAVGCR